MKRLIFFTVSVILILIFLLDVRGNRDELKIRKNISDLESLLTKSSDENPIAGFSRAGKVGTFFTDDCYIAFGPSVPDIHDKDELVTTVQRVRHAVHRVDVGFTDISILSFSDDRDTALLTLTATAVVYESGNIKGKIFAREVESTLVKIDGAWKVKKAMGVESLH